MAVKGVKRKQIKLDLDEEKVELKRKIINLKKSADEGKKKLKYAPSIKKPKIEPEIIDEELDDEEESDSDVIPDEFDVEDEEEQDDEEEEQEEDEELDEEEENEEIDEEQEDGEEEEQDDAVEKKVKKTKSKAKESKEQIEEKLKRRKEQKELREKRRKSENKSYELSVKAKQLWEEVRREDCPKARREVLLNQLLKLLKGHVKQIIRSHDLVRVIECIVKVGDETHRTILFNELKDIIIELCKLKYTKFFVIKMLKYGTKEQKDEIIKSFYGNVRALLSHAEASNVLEIAYSDVANRRQRAALVQEFFGNDYKIVKEETIENLEQALKKQHTELQRTRILETMKDDLVKLTSKSSIKLSITHYLLREYFKCAKYECKQDMIEMLIESVVEILHTKDGSRVALECVWQSNVKQRKFLIKSFKKFISTIATNENGYIVLLAVFDCVDDTVLINKFILTELFDNEKIMELTKDKYAIKVFEYLLSPRDARWFHKDIIAILAKGDNNQHSKKDSSVRQKELRDAVLPRFYNLVAMKCKEFLYTGSTCLLLVNILTVADHQNNDEESNLNEQKQAAMNAFVHVIADEGVYQNDTNHIIERETSQFAIKKLLRASKEMCKLFVKHVPATVLLSYIGCNRGCFLLVNLLESNEVEVINRVRNALTGVNNKLRQKDYKGAQVLLELLKEK